MVGGERGVQQPLLPQYSPLSQVDALSSNGLHFTLQRVYTKDAIFYTREFMLQPVRRNYLKSTEKTIQT
jgi:hypothetical protein